MKMRYVLASGSSAAREIDMNKMKSVICFLALGAISPHAWATPNNDDIKAMLSQAKSGDASAQTQLGILYAEGSGVTRDYKKARSWFEQAGKQNYADAEYNLGVMYGNGDGVARDSKKALTWFEKAAEHGHIGARYNLGMIYGQGIGTAKDLVRAAFWFELAGQDGSPEDKYTLGVMYSKGEPLEKNDVKARQWFERAANEGHVLAQYNLAVMYSEGLGGDRDLRKARHWADKAAGQGDPEATRLLSVLNERGKQSPFEILMVAGGDPAAAPHIVPPVRLGADHGVEKPAAETLSETPAAVINTAPTTESVEIIEIDEGSTGVEIEKITEDAPAEEAMPSDALRSQKMENRESEARAGEAENLQDAQQSSTPNNELTLATGPQAMSEDVPREEEQHVEEDDSMTSSDTSEPVPVPLKASAEESSERNTAVGISPESIKTEK
ncbi:hypothetical protein M1K59_14425 [Klebsiella pneumoniae]|uniref:tetratricopeptide repeat protein n=1 Tax=Klebsiella pneumoniae TaxID=573 RepID=UPI0023635456|nr:hypothetical protein [Klebsiella pneumoniae]MDD1888191.1 hypothetical protein [Klebsiella pneumoniae]MEA4768854.1 hypothetical protein [Klebsiella pneumoniae]